MMFRIFMLSLLVIPTTTRADWGTATNYGIMGGLAIACGLDETDIVYETVARLAKTKGAPGPTDAFTAILQAKSVAQQERGLRTKKECEGFRDIWEGLKQEAAKI